MTTMLRILGAAILALGISGLVAAHSTLASGTQIAGCSFAALQTDLQAGGDWFYAVGQCPSPIMFDSTITISANASLTAQGNDVTLDGGHSSTVNGVRLISTNPGTTLGLSGLTLSHGNSSNYGGAIYNQGTLTVTNSTFSGNSATTSGGAIDNEVGTVTITGSTFSDNSATATGSALGGAINNNIGTMTITDSTFSSNSSGVYGGAISNLGMLTLGNSTFSLNSASGAGGAIYNQDMLTITNSTFFGNSATGDGGAISAFGGTVGIVTSTLSGNSSGSGDGAIFILSGTVKIGGSIIASTTGGNCFNFGGTMTDQGYNLEWSGAGNSDTCGFTGTGDITGSDPLLGSLAPNGGPTETMALGVDSPAIDQILTTYDIPTTSTPLCPAIDQRHYGRPDAAGTNCDMGAYESDAVPTLARVTAFTLYHERARLLFRWRMADTAGVVGFNVYAGAHQLNHHLIPAHLSPTYSYPVRSGRGGGYRLGVVLSSGAEEWVPLG
jgi:predicted outer membrane repeat protein